MPGLEEELTKLGKAWSQPAIRYAISILRSASGCMPSLSRDGKGVEQQVPFVAREAYRLLMQLCKLIPDFLRSATVSPLRAHCVPTA
jgi:hypothetical protein